MVLITSLVLLLIRTCTVIGYERFQQLIPNGQTVPHPCKINDLWRGVGHLNDLGGGLNNPFGRDFKANGLRWDTNLCNIDSDGDGRTNGEELGDPDCMWTENARTKRTAMSHPGICEPFDNPLCNGKPYFVNCDHDELNCPAVEEKDTYNFTVRLPETAVPAKETTYICQTFEFPSDESHVVAYKAIIDNHYVMHHMVVFKCKDDTIVDDVPYACEMNPGRGCDEVIALWSLGMPGVCLHKDSGILIGGMNGTRKAAIQFHWNNPELKADAKDSSGFSFYLTKKLRPYNSGILTIGQTYLDIPPGQERYEAMGVCSSECSASIFTGNITVTSVLNHMHYLGRSQMTELRRNDVYVTALGNDTHYSYDFPILHEFEKGVDVYPGDELRTTCVFKSTSRETTTYYGDETKDEMCFSFLSYFPVDNAKRGRCTSWKSIGHCNWQDGKVHGCDLTTLQNLQNPEMIQIIANVNKKCMPGFCKEECLLYVRAIKKLPCFKGDVDMYMRSQMLTGNPETPSFKLVSHFYSAFDCCDRQLMDEQIEELKAAYSLEKKEAEEACNVDKALATERACSETCKEECSVNAANTIVHQFYMCIFVALYVFF